MVGAATALAGMACRNGVREARSAHSCSLPRSLGGLGVFKEKEQPLVPSIPDVQAMLYELPASLLTSESLCLHSSPGFGTGASLVVLHMQRDIG